ncbi:unnamed protein product [Kuraishia capsulata CBS 1993]|uniref:COP9 signalosome complex subunit 5 n=1 Tax=Kuraishia capsulata CBS 1993 TaxID=1382522 RepID=W6MXG0_9ASCO|nr:uncharacterized protein KUCA_T00004810001 [Kuraishia capsulata CBS 1993]CDK28825.1 unnamed protein product [Kuraishia capsulata CBS 1993]
MSGLSDEPPQKHKTFVVSEMLEQLNRYTSESHTATQSSHTNPNPLQSNSEIDEIIFNTPSDKSLLARKPWASNPHYFHTVHISAIALLKMVMHARSGGSIEIMGMLTGKVVRPYEMVIMDTYPLPVEGTETRVNAQNEGYEFMVQHLERLKAMGKEENLIGWYHSHPGYGCWLSGIDVATQALNQGFQDPYVALVIDPERTFKQSKVEIGAFRTLPDKIPSTPGKTTKSGNKPPKYSTRVPKGKQEDFGVHAKRYYSLEVKVFKSSEDRRVLKALKSNYQFSDILKETEHLTDRERGELFDRLDVLTGRLAKCIPQASVSAQSLADIGEGFLGGYPMAPTKRKRPDRFDDSDDFQKDVSIGSPTLRSRLQSDNLKILARDFHSLVQGNLRGVIVRDVEEALFQKESQ